MSDSGNDGIPASTEQGNKQNLRDRIAAVIDQVIYGYPAELPPTGMSLSAADAVIAALGLELTATSNACDGRFKSWSVEGYWEERKADDE